jgi:hypothetical protein
LAGLGEYLPSGLQLNVVGDDGTTMGPLVVNDRVIKAVGRLRHLMVDGKGLPTTLQATPVNYVVCEGEHPRIQLNTSEEIGQVISDSKSTSSPEVLSRYAEFVGRLGIADVKCLVVSPPPKNPNPIADVQWKKDMIQLGAFLNEGLRLSPRPCAVCIAFNKVDSLADDEQAARNLLTDAVLKEVLKPLVRAVEMSDNVRYGAIIPTSVFGFGQSMIVDQRPPSAASQPDDAELDGWVSGARGHEPISVARPDGSIQPFNIKPFLMWTLLAGALPREIEMTEGDDEPALARVCRMLSHDLAETQGWIVPIKGDLCPVV